MDNNLIVSERRTHLPILSKVEGFSDIFLDCV